MTAPSPFAHSPARRYANVAAVPRRSKPPFYRMIVMNRLSTENVFEDLDGLAEVEIARGLQLVWGSFSLWRGLVGLVLKSCTVTIAPQGCFWGTGSTVQHSAAALVYL